MNALGREPPDYLGRWLAMTAGLFVLSGLVYPVRGHGVTRWSTPSVRPVTTASPVHVSTVDGVGLAHRGLPGHDVRAPVRRQLDDLVAAREGDPQPQPCRSTAMPYGPPGRK